MENTVISHFDIIDVIGEGGMGKVFKARDQRDNRVVALKLLSHKNYLAEELRRRFHREATAGMKLSHPNIVRIFEAGDYGGKFFITMEFVDGCNLRELIRNEPLSAIEAINIGISTAEALKAAHQLGIIHRDIKSENIMLTNHNEIKVMDFGLARVVDTSVLTLQGEILGTISYMSPQQAIGEQVDHRSDIYSLGVVLYELLTRKLPFAGDYEMAVIYSILNEEPMGIRELNSTVPKVLEQVVFKAMKKNVHQRYQDADELISDLKKVKEYIESGELVEHADLELMAAIEVYRQEEKGFFAKLIGREKQFDELKNSLNKAVFGNGQTVFISGEAGIGKTRIVFEIEKFAKTLKVRTIKCKCLFTQIVYPYLPFVEAIRGYFDIKGIDSSDKLNEFIREHAKDLEDISPVIRIFLNLKEDSNLIIENKEQLWDAIFRLIMKISQEHPLIIFIDDIHWAGEDTLNLLYYISRNISLSKIMIVCTYRIEDVYLRIKDKGHPLLQMQHEMIKEGILKLVQLNRLSEIEIEEMTRSIFPNAEINTAFFKTLYNETEGNPFYVIETLKLLKSEGVIEKYNEGFRLNEECAQIKIPSKVHEIIIKRIERLPDSDREILEFGSVEGEIFHSTIIEDCLMINRLKLLRMLQNLEREHHIIHPAEKKYRFDHIKIRDVLYENISPELRVEYHKLIGTYLSKTYKNDEILAPEIANHFINGEEQFKALPFLVIAGNRAKQVFANQQAIVFYNKALDIISNLAEAEESLSLIKEKENILEGLGDVLSLIGSYEESIEKYNQVMDFLNIINPKRIELLWKIGLVNVNKGENRKAQDALESAEMEYEKIIQHINKNTDIRLFDTENFTTKEFLTVLGKIKITNARIFKANGDYSKAKEEIREGLKLLVEEGNFKEKGQAYNDLGNILFDEGEYFEAEKIYTESLKLREKILDKKGIAETNNNLANIYIERGDYQNAAHMLEASIKLMNEIGFKAGISGTLNNLGTIYQDQGRYEEALDVHKRSLLISEETNNKIGILLSYSNLGSVSIDLNNLENAVFYLEKSIQIVKEYDFQIFEPQLLVWLSQALLNLGKLDNAKEKSILALNKAEKLNQRASQGFAKRIQTIITVKEAELSKNTLSDSEITASIENSFRDIINIFKELKMEHELARSYLEYAKYYKIIGDILSMHEYLDEATKIFYRVGAVGDLKKAEQLND